MKTSKIFDATTHKSFQPYSVNRKCITPYTFFIYYDDSIITLPIHGKSSQCGFHSYEEAKKAKKEYEAIVLSNDTVFVVLKNADFIEGRGPMQLDKIFKKIGSAHNYIMSQKGIYGSPQYERLSFGVNIDGELYGSIRYNGYSLERTELITD